MEINWVKQHNKQLHTLRSVMNLKEEICLSLNLVRKYTVIEKEIPNSLA